MSIYEYLKQAIAEERPVSLAVVVAGQHIGARLLIDPRGERLGSLGDPALDELVAADAAALIEEERSETRTYIAGGEELQVFIESYTPPPHLIIVGAVHTAMILCTCARELGFTVTVVDPRGLFATRERFPNANALIVAWPDEAFPQLRMDRSTYVAVLTHDPKLDDPAVRLALQKPVRYVGAIGSPATQEQRRNRLREEGVPEEDLARIHGPVGLDLGGRTPGEIAISILAEMIAVRHGRRLS
ncbi:MAG: xanthine and Co dehydrogenase maturation factor [Herpetosiphonaceae bacterium]|nr:MAG: xanthine and Co dehydrogenase maturation factor [Herpetosiphonaceae bacterium]